MFFGVKLLAGDLSTPQSTSGCAKYSATSCFASWPVLRVLRRKEGTNWGGQPGSRGGSNGRLTSLPMLLQAHRSLKLANDVGPLFEFLLSGVGTTIQAARPDVISNEQWFEIRLSKWCERIAPIHTVFLSVVATYAS